MKKENNKSRSIQSELLRMAEGFANGSMQPPERSNEWNLVGDGNDIEDWEFTNEAIKSLLRIYYANKGNPFTQVKIDARNQLGKYLIEKDYSIIHTRNGHVFKKGISNHFGIFPEKGRTEIDAIIGKKHLIISETAILEHSSAEGVFLGCALFMEEENIYDFLGVPKGVKPVLLPSHRRSLGGIQVEIDGMLVWTVGDQTYIAIFEVKGTEKKVPDWSGGFAYHQVKNTAMTIKGRLGLREYNTTIIPVYFRNEWKKNSKFWNARLDKFEPFISDESTPKIISSLDIINLPR